MSQIAEMKLGAIAPWFGGKRTLAPVIVEELGKHRAYWEPFCGSMAVLLAKDPCQQETVCDLHADLTNLARVLAGPETSQGLYKMLQRLLCAEELFEGSRRYLAYNSEPGDEPDVMRAFHYFAFSWLGRNGLAGTHRALTSALALRYTPGGGSPTVRFASAVDSIPAWHERLRRVLILRRNAFDILPELPDDEDVAIYADPPYLLDTRSAGASKEQGSKYVHDFEPGLPAEPSGLFGGGEEKRPKDPHERLAKILRRFKKARVVISYYDSPRLLELYPGWVIRHLEANKNIASQNRRDQDGRTEAPEVLVLNGEGSLADSWKARAIEGGPR
jgi:DNA adenine methylase